MKITVFKETKEDWCPSYSMEKRKLLRVSFLSLNSKPYRYRVCVWGADDFGMEKDFVGHDPAYRIFKHIIKFEYLTRDALKYLGFKQA